MEEFWQYMVMTPSTDGTLVADCGEPMSLRRAAEYRRMCGDDAEIWTVVNDAATVARNHREADELLSEDEREAAKEAAHERELRVAYAGGR